MKAGAREPTVQPFTIRCASAGCESRFEFRGGTVTEFLQAFSAAHYEGWICLMESILDMTCPRCNATSQRRLQSHQLMRSKLEDQPAWKRDIVVLAWAAMAHIHDNDYLRDTDMPSWLNALLGKETTAKAAHVRHALEHLQWNLERYSKRPEAVEAARLARSATAR